MEAKLNDAKYRVVGMLHRMYIRQGLDDNKNSLDSPHGMGYTSSQLAAKKRFIPTTNEIIPILEGLDPDIVLNTDTYNLALLITKMHRERLGILYDDDADYGVGLDLVGPSCDAIEDAATTKTTEQDSENESYSSRSTSDSDSSSLSSSFSTGSDSDDSEQEESEKIYYGITSATVSVVGSKLPQTAYVGPKHGRDDDDDDEDDNGKGKDKDKEGSDRKRRKMDAKIRKRVKKDMKVQAKIGKVRKGLQDYNAVQRTNDDKNYANRPPGARRATYYGWETRSSTIPPSKIDDMLDRLASEIDEDVLLDTKTEDLIATVIERYRMEAKGIADEGVGSKLPETARVGPKYDDDEYSEEEEYQRQKQIRKELVRNPVLLKKIQDTRARIGRYSDERTLSAEDMETVETTAWADINRVMTSFIIELGGSTVASMDTDDLVAMTLERCRNKANERANRDVGSKLPQTAYVGPKQDGDEVLTGAVVATSKDDAVRNRDVKVMKDVMAMRPNDTIIARNILEMEDKELGSRLQELWDLSNEGGYMGAPDVVPSPDRVLYRHVISRKVIFQRDPCVFSFFKDDGIFKMQGFSDNPEIPLEVTLFNPKGIMPAAMEEEEEKGKAATAGNYGDDLYLKKEWHIRDSFNDIHDDALAVIGEHHLKHPRGMLAMAGKGLLYPLSDLKVSLEEHSWSKGERDGTTVYAGRCPTKEICYVYLTFKRFEPDEEVLYHVLPIVHVPGPEVYVLGRDRMHPHRKGLPTLSSIAIIKEVGMPSD